MAEFYTILTAIGKAKLANSTALGTKLNLTKFQVGDGAGSYYNPTESQTTLKNKLWEGSIGSISVDSENPNWIILETIIPSQDGGFTIREAGIFDDENNLIAIGKYPETYKPVLSEGSAKDLIIKMILEVSNTSSVTLKVDPTVILATKKDVEILESKIKNIKFPIESVNDKTGNVVLTANDIKTVSGITIEERLAEFIDFKKTKGQFNGLASLGSDGIVPSSQLPKNIKFVNGTYVGNTTNKSSENNTLKIITGFTPKLIIINEVEYYTEHPNIYLYNATEVCILGSSLNGKSTIKTNFIVPKYDGFEVSTTGGSNNHYGPNNEKFRYYYIAIG